MLGSGVTYLGSLAQAVLSRRLRLGAAAEHAGIAETRSQIRYLRFTRWGGFPMTSATAARSVALVRNLERKELTCVV
jgi:hypothetical protein